LLVFHSLLGWSVFSYSARPISFSYSVRLVSFSYSARLVSFSYSARLVNFSFSFSYSVWLVSFLYSARLVSFLYSPWLVSFSYSALLAGFSFSCYLPVFLSFLVSPQIKQGWQSFHLTIAGQGSHTFSLEVLWMAVNFFRPLYGRPISRLFWIKRTVEITELYITSNIRRTAEHFLALTGAIYCEIPRNLAGKFVRNLALPRHAPSSLYVFMVYTNTQLSLYNIVYMDLVPE